MLPKGLMNLRNRFLAGIMLTVLAIGCGGNNAISGTRGVEDYVGTQQPGDVWAWSIGASTFTASNETLSHTYAGDVMNLPSGFTKLTISSTNDSAVSVGTQAYSIEIPGTCLLVKPAGSEFVSPIIATGLGSNPTAQTLAMNWITIPSADFDVQNSDAFGTANFTKTQAGYDAAIDFGKLDYSEGPLDQGSGATLVHQDGRYIIEGDDIVFGLQQSGVFMADFGPNLGGIIGMQAPTRSIPWPEIAGKTFIGMMAESGRTQLITVKPGIAPDTLQGDGLVTDTEISTGINTGSGDGGVTLELLSTVSNGLFAVNLNYGENGNNNERMFFVAGEVEGKIVLFGFAGNAQNGTYNVLLVEKQ